MKKALLLVCLLCLTACSHTYLERQIYPLVMSIDLKDGQYVLGLQCPKSASGDPAYDTLSASGKTPEEALSVLRASTPYPLHFSQVRQCLIGYELAASTPLRPLLRWVLELPAMRPNAQVMVAQGSAIEVMQAQKPAFGQRLSTHLNLLFERMQREGTLPDSNLSYCVRELGDGRSDLLLGLCAINPSLEEQPAFSPLLPEGQTAGLMPRTGPEAVEYIGSAAVSVDRVCGTLTGEETQLALRTLEYADLRIAPDSLQLQIFLPRGSELAGQEAAVRQLMEKLQALHCDALRFGCLFSKGFRTQEEWLAFDFRAKYPSAPHWVGVK